MARSIMILVIEKDPHIRELEAHFLGNAGFSIEFANDGIIALEAAKRLKPDLIITEILVPKLDGLSVCRKLKADEATSSILVLVFSILSAAKRASEAGADAFLMKPLAEHRLLAAVQGLIDKRSA